MTSIIPMFLVTLANTAGDCHLSSDFLSNRIQHQIQNAYYFMSPQSHGAHSLFRQMQENPPECI